MNRSHFQMRNTLSYSFACVALAMLFVPAIVTAQEDPNKPVPLPDIKVKFDGFQDVPWETVIQDFAEDAKLDLRFFEPPPTEPFSSTSEKERTALQALDYLNQNLSPHDRILIRSGESLFLFDTTKGIREDLIETIDAADLDKRGRYEVFKCRFSLEGISDPASLRNEVEQLVSDVYRRKMVVAAAANIMIVQDSGLNLRSIREVVERARLTSNDFTARYIEVKHIMPMDAITAAQAALAYDAAKNESNAGTLTLSNSGPTNRILATGAPKAVSRFEALVKTIDIDFGTDSDTNLESPYFKSYKVDGDAAEVYAVAQTMLSGRAEVILGVDEKANKLNFSGRKADHEALTELLTELTGSSSNFAIYPVKNGLAEDLIDQIKEIYNLNSLEAVEDQPTVSEIDQERIVIKGNPSQVAEITNMLEQIDTTIQRDPSERLPRRFVRMNDSEVDQSLDLLEGLLPTLGLNDNDIQVVMPGEKMFNFDRKSRAFKVVGGENSAPEVRRRAPMPRRPQSKAPAQSTESVPPATSDRDGQRDGPTMNRMRKTNPNKKTGMVVPTESSFRLASFQRVVQQEEQEEGRAGKTSSEQKRNQDVVDAIPTVPGAPVTIRVTEFGISLESDDLEALDRIEDMLIRELDAVADDPQMTLFMLENRDANEAKQMLESYLGLGGGGGGGGNPLTNVVAGAARNAMGPAGGLLDAFGGGGASGAAGVYEPIGDVGIVADPKAVTLLVSAITEDMEKIRSFIEIIDQPSAIQNPKLAGDTYTIEIYHKSAAEVAEIVRTNLSVLIKGAEPTQGGAGGNPQQAILQALSGGKSGSQQLESPKAALSVDEANQKLIVTGPAHIYEAILTFVELVDVRSDRPVPSMDMMASDGISPTTLAQLAELQYPGQIEIEFVNGEGEVVAPSAAASGGTSQGRTGAPSATANPQAAQMGEFIRRMQQAQQRGGRGGGNRGGGFTRGGGQRGGGGRGGGGRGGR